MVYRGGSMNVGARVFAMSHAEGDVAYLYGHGVYMGRVLPPKGIQLMGIDLHTLGHQNPKILLDNGQVVWGCESWWGSEDKMPHYREIKLVDIHEARMKAYGCDPMFKKEPSSES